MKKGVIVALIVAVVILLVFSSWFFLPKLIKPEQPVRPACAGEWKAACNQYETADTNASYPGEACCIAEKSCPGIWRDAVVCMSSGGTSMGRNFGDGSSKGGLICCSR